ncbi:hypothetical protein AOLI_G00093260 [Acnodon oligacanthus]
MLLCLRRRDVATHFAARDAVRPSPRNTGSVRVRRIRVANGNTAGSPPCRWSLIGVGGKFQKRRRRIRVGVSWLASKAKAQCRRRELVLVLGLKSSEFEDKTTTGLFGF